ncbi:MAG: hypothetical protein GY928_14170 [Colwellia sp.]|nr:hypothetical protein [Colwellia sp.]
MKILTSKEFREQEQAIDEHQFSFEETMQLQKTLNAIAKGDLCEAKQKDKALSTALSNTASIKARKLIQQQKHLKQLLDKADPDEKASVLSLMVTTASKLTVLNIGVALKDSRLIKVAV